MMGLCVQSCLIQSSDTFLQGPLLRRRMSKQNELALELEKVGQHVDELCMLLYPGVTPNGHAAEVHQAFHDHVGDVGMPRPSKKSQVVH